MGILDKRTEMENKILSSMPYSWARKHYKDGNANHWQPEEVNMQDDVAQWNSNKSLSEKERQLVKWNLSLFATAEALTQDNILIALFPYIQDAYARQYMVRQAYEEAIHTDTLLYVIDSLNLNIDEIYRGYYTIPAIKEKDDFVIGLTRHVNSEGFDISTTKGKQGLFRDIFGFYGILEGISFYGNFAQILSMKRQNKMVGLGKQIDFILRDEGVHVAFGFDLMNTIKSEYPEVWTGSFKNEIIGLIEKAVELEKEYNEGSVPDGILGLTSKQFNQYIEYIADRRLVALGLEKIYGVENPFPWLGVQQDLLKEENFFEGTVSNYQTATLDMNF